MLKFKGTKKKNQWSKQVDSIFPLLEQKSKKICTINWNFCPRKISIDSSTKNNKASEVDYSKKEKIDLWREDDWKKLLKKFISTIIFLSSSPTKSTKIKKKKKKREEEDSYLSQQDRIFLHAEPRRRKILRQNQFRLKRQGH